MGADLPNSADNNVVSTMALVINEVLLKIREEITDVKFVYDAKNTFESALSAYRTKNNIEHTKVDFYPCFAFSRTSLRYATEAQGRRAVVDRVSRRLSPEVVGAGLSEVYRSIYGDFDLNFRYYTRKAEDLERFEIAYLAEEGISGTTEVRVDLNQVIGGTQPYYLSFSEFTDEEFQSDNVYYKAVAGTIKVRGHYLLFRGNAKQILHINSRIKTFESELLSSRFIDAP